MSVVVLLCPAVIFDLWGCDWYGGKVPEPSPPPNIMCRQKLQGILWRSSPLLKDNIKIVGFSISVRSITKILYYPLSIE